MRAALAVLVTAVLLAAGCSSDDSWERAACSPARRGAGEGMQSIDITTGGVPRHALLYVPKGYDGSEEFPLVFNWHGYGSSAEEHLAYADMLPLADDEGFLVLGPDGTGDPKRFNLGSGITSSADDVAFAGDLLDELSSTYCVDARRVYSVGASNGGGMSGVLACSLGSRFAAVGMVALELKPSTCDGLGSPPPAVLGIQGDADLVVPFQGGRVNCCGGWPIAPAQETMQQWADALGCGDPSDDRVSKHVTERTWHGCDDGRSVVFYRVHGGGHTWPGKEGKGPLGYTTGEIDASKIAWDFFKKYSLPAN